MSIEKRYNLRVYALILNEQGEVLISNERRNGFSFTKFPGGGLEWGESTVECIQRELREELNIEVEVGDLFYVNDFFQQSAFRSNDQLFSFYYFCRLTHGVIHTVAHPIPMLEEGEAFRWVKCNELNESMFTFPIDKRVVNQLLKEIACSK